MRALVLTEFGGPENLKLASVERPVVQPGQLLIRIHSSAVNPVDIKIRGGLPIAPVLPAILGADLAGIVEEVGLGVVGFHVGDEVYGCAGGVKGHGGTLAEFIAADARLIAHKPATLSFREAAALPLVAITASDAMERGGVTAGKHVLVHGGLGGVGHIAVQLAKVAGARVTSTVGSDDAVREVQALGADTGVNYNKVDVAHYVAELTQGSGFDVVVDTVGGANLPASFEAATVGGCVVTTNARTTTDLSLVHSKALSLHAVFMLLPMLRGEGRERHGDILRKIASLVDAGALQPRLEPTRFTLETAAAAQTLLAEGKARGKVVVEIS